MIIFNNQKYKPATAQRVVSNIGTQYARRSYTAQLQAVFARASALGYAVPNTSLKNKLDDYMRDLISLGIYDSADYYMHAMFGEASFQDFSLINWRRPFGALSTLNGSGSISAYGYKGNGANFYINTNFNPATQGLKYTLNNAGRAALVYDSSAPGFNQSVIDGVAGSNLYNNMWNFNEKFHRINQNANDIASAVDLSGTGLTTINRDDANALRFTKRDIVTSTTAASTSILSAAQTVLRRNTDYGANGISLYYNGGSLPTAKIQGWRVAGNRFSLNLGLTAIF